MGMEVQESSPDVRKILFGRYEMGRFLGKGTFAKVYFARDLSSGDGVAVKVLSKNAAECDGALMAQIMREISAMRLVRHPNVIEIREVMATKSRIYIVMEFARGGELFARIARGKLPEDLARRYFHQLISAIEYCHRLGVSHRDIKPENLLLDDKGDLKVADFGLSALPEHRRHDGLLHSVVGSPAYAAPEVLRRRGYDGAKADLWSCGVILFALLAGFLPFQDENLMRMYRKIFKAEYNIPPWVTSDARRLISRFLVADPEKRITIAEIRQLPWFKMGIRRPMSMPNFSPSPPNPRSSESEDEDLEEDVEREKTAKPRFYNAFEFITSMSSGFNLSRLFESRRKTGTAFTSSSPALTIVQRLQKLGIMMGLKVRHSRKKYKVKMEKREGDGRTLRLKVAAEVFEVAPELVVVDLTKTAGDSFEYGKFCEDIRPLLKDIVWAWQGDGDDDAAGDRHEQKNGHR